MICCKTHQVSRVKFHTVPRHRLRYKLFPLWQALCVLFCIVIFTNATANTSSASHLIISTCTLQIQLGPLAPSCYISSTAEIIFFLGGGGGSSNLLHNINIFCREPSRLRLPDKLTEVIDNSFDSKLQLSIAPGAPLAGVCCDKRTRRSSPDRDFCRPRWQRYHAARL